jgi:DNA-directed RNA polymerase specialized sigma24 family protein
MSVCASEEVSVQPEGQAAADATLENIFRLQYPRLVSLLARLTGDRGSAEELASEVFCRLSSRPVLFRPDSNLEGWLYRTAVNLGLDALRMAARRKRHEQAAGVETLRISRTDTRRRTQAACASGAGRAQAGFRKAAVAPQCRVIVRRVGGCVAAQAGIGGQTAGAGRGRI